MQDVDIEAMRTVQREFDEIAALIESNLEKGPNSMKKRINLYTLVYTAATRSKLQHVDEHYAAHKELYIMSQDILSGYMSRFNEGLISQLHELPPERIFHAVVRRWQNYKPMKHWIGRTFSYLSRFYIEHQDKPSLETVALSIFYHQLFKHVMPKMRAVILQLVARERDGETVDRGAVQLGIELFSKMSFDPSSDIYHAEFLAPYVDATAAYYERAALLWIATESATDYLRRAEDKINEERLRCKQYFASAAEKVIIDRVAAELLGKHQRTLMNKPHSGFASCLRDMRSEEIRRFCALFSIVPDGLPPLGQLLRDHCVEEGTEIVKRYACQGADATVDFRGYVADVMTLHAKYTRLLSLELSSLPIFQVAVKEGIESVVNKGVTITSEAGVEGVISCCELLALFCDSVIRQSADSGVNSEAEALFDKVVALVMYVADKDIFQQHARHLLCRRLLSGTTSKEREEPLITRLKDKFGLPFTAHFEGMLNDRDASQDLREKFQAHCSSSGGPRPGFDFSCQVLTTGFWPTFTTGEARPPQAVQQMMTRFEEFYIADKGKQRVLKWSHAEGAAFITAHFSADKEFQMSPMQACVLLRFESDAPVALAELHESCAIELDELKRILGSLIRTKLLLRSETDFSVNAGFTSQKRKLVVAPTQPKVSVANSQVVASNVEDDRKGAVDACLVRIMKSRRKLSHAELVTECVQHLKQRFSPDARQIKLRIEDLINREYLERDGVGYVYKA